MNARRTFLASLLGLVGLGTATATPTPTPSARQTKAEYDAMKADADAYRRLRQELTERRDQVTERVYVPVDDPVALCILVPHAGPADPIL